MIDPRLRLRHLRCFLETARLGSVSAAAEALHISQPAVSKTIRELEDILGTALFTRSGRRLVLSRAGRVFQSHAGTAMIDLGRAQDLVREAPRTSSRLMIGALPTAATTLVPEAAVAFRAARPDCLLRVSTGPNWLLASQLREGTLDMVVGRMAPAAVSGGLSFRQLVSEPVVAVVRPKTFIGPARLGVFEILFDWVDSGVRIPVIGNGNNRYQLLDVADLVEAVRLTLTEPAEVANDTFNIGAERFDTVRQDLTVLCEHAGNGARVMGTPAPLVKTVLAIAEALKMSPLYKWVYGTADKDSFVSIDRAKEKLGWQPRYSNSETLVRAYDWYHENKDKIPKGSGITHRIGWDQGILKVFKKLA